MKMYIPEIGTELRTTAAWTFRLQREHRQKLWDLMVPKDFGKDCGMCLGDGRCEAHNSVLITLPENSKLVVDRIYIRKGVRQFSSITLRLTECSDPGAFVGGKTLFTKSGTKSTRFWVSLTNFNDLEADVLLDTTVKQDAQPTRGEPVSLYDWAERCKKVKAPRWWVTGTVGGIAVDEVVVVEYERARPPGYWQKNAMPSELFIGGRWIHRKNSFNSLTLQDVDSLLKPGKTAGASPASIAGRSLDDNPRDFELSFYKVVEV